MMFEDVNLVNLENNNTEKEGKHMENTIKITTKKSNLVKFAKIQFLGILLLAAAMIMVALIIRGKTVTNTVTVEKEVKIVDQQAVDAAAQEKFEQFKANYQPEVVTVTETVEVEKVVEVEKPVTITETVEVPVEVEKPIYVETVKTVEVVDQQMVTQLATEMANNMYNAYKEAYTAQVDEAATEAVIEAKTAELQAQYTSLMNEYMAQADAEKVVELATTMANNMFEQFKQEYIIEYTAAQEAARVANTSVIRVLVYTPESYFFLEITGSLHDELTWGTILTALEADERFGGLKIKKIEHKDAVEAFIGRDFDSTRVIHTIYK